MSKNDKAPLIISEALRAKMVHHIAKIERLEGEKAEIIFDINSEYAMLKKEGFNTKAIKDIIRERMKPQPDMLEQEEMKQLYREILGMQNGEPNPVIKELEVNSITNYDIINKNKRDRMIDRPKQPKIKKEKKGKKDASHLKVVDNSAQTQPGEETKPSVN
jgi:uncharacterized protein (UPF0335 family)